MFIAKITAVAININIDSIIIVVVAMRIMVETIMNRLPPTGAHKQSAQTGSAQSTAVPIC